MSTKRVDKSTIMRGLGKRLSYLLAIQRVSNAKLARHISKDPSTVGDYVNGSVMPTADVLFDIAIFLDTSVEYLLTGKERRDPDKRSYYPNDEILEDRRYDDRNPGKGDFSDIDFLPIRKAITRKYGRGDYEFLKITDSSMEPTFPKESIVVFKKERAKLPSLNKGQTKTSIWCLNVRDESGIIFRKVRFLEKENYLELIPINILKHDVKRYRPRDITILGRVIGIAWQDI
jgi:transcriptional regulator with XRE-family HTH domain